MKYFYVRIAVTGIGHQKGIKAGLYSARSSGLASSIFVRSSQLTDKPHPHFPNSLQKQDGHLHFLLGLHSFESSTASLHYHMPGTPEPTMPGTIQTTIDRRGDWNPTVGSTTLHPKETYVTSELELAQKKSGPTSLSDNDVTYLIP
ncbi:hypothetical protein CSKR_102774 [Clonorchis sinensis]|uniref:Uncharacterized protein n=1 Tax=Clonorchis sinensis TaxID=79923 RepID=A0A3R7DI06_CLOSI|nr:hypothetical protein CSKR_102774 [Clonorchis sinensis]